jgi:hypothetical protein
MKYTEPQVKAANLTKHTAFQLQNGLTVAPANGLLRRAVPNKPVLPTVPTSLDEHSPCSLRRQTGQPFGGIG